MTKIKCWRLESVSLEGPNRLMARFNDHETAEAAGKYCRGYGLDVVEEEITIFDNVVEYNPRLDSAAIVAGLAKLTAREKRALGLD
jgi:hypothetical protein